MFDHILKPQYFDKIYFQADAGSCSLSVLKNLKRLKFLAAKNLQTFRFASHRENKFKSFSSETNGYFWT